METTEPSTEVALKILFVLTRDARVVQVVVAVRIQHGVAENAVCHLTSQSIDSQVARYTQPLTPAVAGANSSCSA